jgi:hypothetical protein
MTRECGTQNETGHGRPETRVGARRLQATTGHPRCCGGRFGSRGRATTARYLSTGSRSARRLDLSREQAATKRRFQTVWIGIILSRIPPVPIRSSKHASRTAEYQGQGTSTGPRVERPLYSHIYMYFTLTSHFRQGYFRLIVFSWLF